MITIDSLTKKYGRTTVVDGVSFVARPGRVTGFLGPNGAGKSTTMRMVVGLTKPTSGSATVAGRRFADLPNPGREIGVMLDASAQHAGPHGPRDPHRSPSRCWACPAAASTRCSTLVSLTRAEADRRVGNYSLGMRQRLGIATALIGDPSVLAPRRARERARPGRDPVDARPAPQRRGPGWDRAAVVAPAPRDRDHRRRHRDDRRAAGSSAQGSKAELPPEGRGCARRPARRRCRSPSRRSGGPASQASYGDDGAVHSDADTTVVGLVARESGIALTEAPPCRWGDGGLVPKPHRHHPERPRRERSMTTTTHVPAPDPGTTSWHPTPTGSSRCPCPGSSAWSSGRCSTPVPGSG